MEKYSTVHYTVHTTQSIQMGNGHTWQTKNHALKYVERTEDEFFELCTGQCLQRRVLKNQRAMEVSPISDLKGAQV